MPLLESASGFQINGGSLSILLGTDGLWSASATFNLSLTPAFSQQERQFNFQPSIEPVGATGPDSYLHSSQDPSHHLFGGSFHQQIQARVNAIGGEENGRECTSLRHMVMTSLSGWARRGTWTTTARASSAAFRTEFNFPTEFESMPCRVPVSEFKPERELSCRRYSLQNAVILAGRYEAGACATHFPPPQGPSVPHTNLAARHSTPRGSRTTNNRDQDMLWELTSSAHMIQPSLIHDLRDRAHARRYTPRARLVHHEPQLKAQGKVERHQHTLRQELVAT
ncbi:hypothetical protein B0H19DRAFT_1072983 [Mycena capillaripes]|nr:hypothetical protein B0H19DRAFT_1072983 [Mycena capillaripes]